MKFITRIFPQITHINESILTCYRDALTKMRDVYTKNPALGDPNSTDKELAAIGKKLDALRLELQKYQVSVTLSNGQSMGTLTKSFKLHSDGVEAIG